MNTQLHTEFARRVVLNTHHLPWVPSPVDGVERRLLERDGGEIARATSIVRYGAGTRFNAHGHELGEEFLVLDGTLEDEHGSYPAGTYVKNPPGSCHAPFTLGGATLLVKLRYMEPADTARIVVDTHTARWYPGVANGLSVMPLHEYGTQHTAMVRWAAGTRFSRHRHFGGEEIYVVSGTFEDELGNYPIGTWIRSPHMRRASAIQHSGLYDSCEDRSSSPANDRTPMKHFSELSSAAERIVDVAEALIQQHGYNGFSYEDVARQVGIKKPSIHHHFPAKAELVAVVAQRYTHRFRSQLLAIEGRKAKAAQRLSAYASLFESTYSQDRRLCVCGMLGAEAQGLPLDVAREVDQFFSINIEWLTQTFQAGAAEGSLRLSTTPQAHARLFLCALEGAMVVGRGSSAVLGPALVGESLISLMLP